MTIGTTDDETVDRWGGVVHDAQGRGGQYATSKGGTSILDITGDMAVCRSAGRIS